MASCSQLSVKDENTGTEKKEKNEEEIEDDSDEDDDSSDESLYEGITEFHGEEHGDLSFTTGEVLSILSKRKDGWWIAENSKGKTGLVPSTYLEPHLRSGQKNIEDIDNNNSSSEEEKPKNKSQTENIAKDSWNFCPSSLSDLENKDNRYSTSVFLQPKLSQSGLGFRDIHWDDANNNLKANVARCQRLITLTECRYMPETKQGLEISSYYIRMCLHDGSKVLSNIHTTRAKLDSKDPQNWTFSSSVSQSGNYLEDGRIFVRTTNTSTNIGILFQPCLQYRIQDEKGELSYGWTFMRLLDDSGNAISNKSKVLHIHGGCPFEETATVKQDERRVSRTFISKDRYPSLIVRIITPDRDIRQQLNLFPDVLIGPASLIPHISLYRQTLADCLLHQRSSSDSTELLHAPVESTFPKLFNQPDILDAFRKAWIEKIKNEKKSNKKDAEKIKQLFREVYKETAYLLIHCNILPLYSFGDIQIEQIRQKEIERLLQIRQTKGPLGILLAPNISCQPFSIHEASIDIVSKACIPFE